MLLVLNLTGAFAFGLSGALAAARARLDLFGIVVLAAVVGLAGGIVRDVLIGVRPIALRDWRYLAAPGAAAALVILTHPRIERLEPSIEILDAAGLSLFSVTGAAAGIAAGFGGPEAVVLGALSAIGGGVLRDVLLGQVPMVLRRGLYAVPAVLGATIFVLADAAGGRGDAIAILAAAICFVTRMVGLRYQIDLPRPRPQKRRP